jgi:hypothetical protein
MTINYKPARIRVVCKDGFNISVQAGDRHYSLPRNDTGLYSHVECGFPSAVDVLLIPFAEGSNFVRSIYPYVPAEVIDKVIRLHGGIESGELPELLLA